MFKKVKLVDYTFRQRGREYNLKTYSTGLTNGNQGNLCEIFYKNELLAICELESIERYSLYRIKFMKEFTERQCYDIADLCSNVLHSAVMF